MESSEAAPIVPGTAPAVVSPHPELVKLCNLKRLIEIERRNAMDVKKRFDSRIKEIHIEIQNYMLSHELTMFLDPITLQPYNVSNQLICGKKPSAKRQQADGLM